MQIAGMILGCLLLSQAPDAALSLPGSRAAPHRSKPAEMVAEAIAIPPGGALTGQPLSLLSALGSTADRRQQLEVAHAYWRLAEAMAAYHFCWDHAQEIARVKPAAGEPAGLRLARASAAAMLNQSELEAIRVQCELARLVRMAANAPLPLPADHPHVGAYRTNFRELFAGRSAPEPAQLMERILPLRRQAIDDRAAAVQAAEDVLTAASDDLQSRSGQSRRPGSPPVKSCCSSEGR